MNQYQLTVDTNTSPTPPTGQRQAGTPGCERVAGLVFSHVVVVAAPLHRPVAFPRLFLFLFQQHHEQGNRRRRSPRGMPNGRRLPYPAPRLAAWRGAGTHPLAQPIPPLFFVSTQPTHPPTSSQSSRPWRPSSPSPPRLRTPSPPSPSKASHEVTHPPTHPPTDPQPTHPRSPSTQATFPCMAKAA